MKSVDMGDYKAAVGRGIATVAKNRKTKPCPFCGCERAYSWFTFPESDEEPGWSIAYQVTCDECHARTSWFTTEQEAFDAWNRRVEE